MLYVAHTPLKSDLIMMKATLLQTPAVSYDTLSIGLGDIGKIKDIYTDASLSLYSSDGYEGIIKNYETTHQLRKLALSQARAGADLISSSDMMEGSIRAIRHALDGEEFHKVYLMSYTAKIPCPLRLPVSESLYLNLELVDEKTYQMEAILKLKEEAIFKLNDDSADGANIIMVKTISRLKLCRVST